MSQSEDKYNFPSAEEILGPPKPEWPSAQEILERQEEEDRQVIEKLHRNGLPLFVERLRNLKTKKILVYSRQARPNLYTPLNKPYLQVYFYTDLGYSVGFATKEEWEKEMIPNLEKKGFTVKSDVGFSWVIRLQKPQN